MSEEVQLSLVLRSCEWLRGDMRVVGQWLSRQLDPDDLDAKLYGDVYIDSAILGLQEAAQTLAVAALQWGENCDQLREFLAGRGQLHQPGSPFDPSFSAS